MKTQDAHFELLYLQDKGQRLLVGAKKYDYKREDNSITISYRTLLYKGCVDYIDKVLEDKEAKIFVDNHFKEIAVAQPINTQEYIDRIKEWGLEIGEIMFNTINGVMVEAYSDYKVITKDKNAFLETEYWYYKDNFRSYADYLREMRPLAVSCEVCGVYYWEGSEKRCIH